jgi:hypothetical protein
MALSDSSYTDLARLLDGVKALYSAIQIFSMNPPMCLREAERWALFLPYISGAVEIARLKFCCDLTANCRAPSGEVVGIRPGVTV